MFVLGKFSLIILTRCNLKCKLCCEYVPQNKPFPDMTVEEARRILAAVFEVADRIETLHLTGGGEPFLHPKLAKLVVTCMEYSDRFDRLMLFTNSTVPASGELIDILKKFREKLIVQVSHYGIKPEREMEILRTLTDNGIICKVEKYYGEDQSFGGWVDFGDWYTHGRTETELRQIFSNCAVTRDMCGNWRTRDGKVHWCTRSQRGMELGFIPDFTDDYVDLFDGLSIDEKRAKFESIASAAHIDVCNYCSGEQGTMDKAKRFPAAEQMDKIKFD